MREVLYFPRRPDHIVKRTIRGMLPYKRERGADAFRRVKVYVGVPDELADSEMESPEEDSREPSQQCGIRDTRFGEYISGSEILR